MSNFEDFIVEIGTEELPPKELQQLVASFAEHLTADLASAGLTFGEVKTFATPRRLAIFIKQLATQQPQQTITKRGPALTAAYNADGSPTKAALGFASSCGVSMQDLTTQTTDKGAWLYFEQQVSGQQTAALLPTMIEKSLQQLPIKRPMRWGTGAFAFVRPVHWVLMLLGKNIVKANIFGIEANNFTIGHRIHSPKPIKISTPSSYEEQLANEGKVIADFAKRQQHILDAINTLAKQAHGTAVIDPALLTLVTGLVEYPVALMADFNKDFLRVPKECLISSMQDHQKCFALTDANGALMPKFILISNLESIDPKTVIRGNELVMNARLADAAFYFDKDQQQTLESRNEQLKTVTYQKKLGSVYDKVLRIADLCSEIAEQTKIDTNKKQNIKVAANLCKADLMTNMVYEFPELQGIMGSYYAKHDGNNEQIALAIEEHYKPKFSQDELPSSEEGTCIALADRVDTLVGMFGIGNLPTGEKDPYGLRRQAIAILRILIEKDINLDLKYILSRAKTIYSEHKNDAINSPSTQLLEFFSERLKAWYTSNGIPAKTVASVLATIDHNATNFKSTYIPADINRRIKAVTEFQALSTAESLSAANKRVQNLLEKSSDYKSNNNPVVNSELFSTPEEKELFAALEAQEHKNKDGDYNSILQSLSTLQIPVDNFFTNVMVMVEDEKVRNNRLNLLQRLRNLFLQVADVSLL